MIVVEKLSLRTTDYLVTVNIEEGRFLSKLVERSKGMSCVGEINKNKFNKLKNLKVVDSLEKLDESVFNKALARYNEKLDIKNLVRISDNLALVLIQNVPKNKESTLISLLNNKAGIFETWFLKRDKSNNRDLLFKVRKYKFTGEK